MRIAVRCPRPVAVGPKIEQPRVPRDARARDRENKEIVKVARARSGVHSNGLQHDTRVARATSGADGSLLVWYAFYFEK